MIPRTLNLCSRTKQSLPRATSSSVGRGTCLVSEHKDSFGEGNHSNANAGNGIINADGPLWKIQRKAGQHFLSAANLKVLTDQMLPVYIMQTFKTLDKQPHGQAVDMEAVFHELTTQLMGQMAYGVCSF